MGILMFELIAALIVFLFPLAYSPGPGNMFFAANGARFGFASIIPALIGYHLATWIITAAIGFGFIAALEQYPDVFAVIKIAGAFYVFWIAWKMISSGTLTEGETAKEVRFRDGVILFLLNPKAYAIIALMFTQFLEPSGEIRFMPVIAITTIFTLNNLIAFTVWTVIGNKIAGFFIAPESAQKLNTIFGLILVLVAIWMLLS